jgi:hypothetical protein
MEVILEEMAAREYIPVDTVVCDEQGNFQMEFTPERIAFYVLRIGPNGYVTLLLEPGEQLEFTGAYGNSSNYLVEGSPGSGQLRILAAAHRRVLDSLGQITRSMMEKRTNPSFTQIKLDLDRQFDSLCAAFKAYSLAYIHRNQPSPVILIALYNLYGQGLPVFHPEEDLATYRFVDSVLMKEYPELEAVQLLHAQLREEDALSKRETQLPAPGVGEFAPDFVSSRPDGSTLSLSELKGNYVLLSFWAGWSKPSREENRYLKEAWAAYGKQSFRILQVSLDNDREQWEQAISGYGQGWDHVGDLVRWDTPVADLYRLEKIPSNFLIGPDGKILAKDLYGEELIQKLETIFGKR